jgi:hypothetical protein
MSYQGHVEKGMVVLDQPMPFPDGTPVLVEPISIAPGNFWQSFSLDELAHQQGVSMRRSLDDLVGGWPADELNDEFEETLRQWRERELEQRP